MTTTESHLAPPPGLVAGKYRCARLIGRGGMGTVWEGQHASLGTRVAIKFIDAEYANSGDARKRFETEARAAATIESKHAIQVYDHGVMEDGRPYIVMELLVGEALDVRLKRMGRMPLADVARIVRQVCRALTRAHEHGIIHRDLKPENIFLVQTPDDDEEIAKVLDFGIAKIKLTPGAVDVSSSTKTGTLLGTPFYMSPEQARGLRDVDHRSDLWAIGVIVFRCVTGELPFEGESLGDLLVKLCTAPIPVPSETVTGVAPAFDAWLARALDRDPAARFQTAAELADALSLTAGLSVRSSAPSGFTPGLTPSGDVYAREVGATRVTPPAVRLPRDPAVDGFGSTEYNQTIPGATSAPFTASTPRATKRSSPGLLVGLTLACLTVGFGLVMSLSGKVTHGSATSGSQSVAPTTLAAAPAVGSPTAHDTPATAAARNADPPATPTVPAAPSPAGTPPSEATARGGPEVTPRAGSPHPKPAPAGWTGKPPAKPLPVAPPPAPPPLPPTPLPMSPEAVVPPPNLPKLTNQTGY